MTDTPYTVVNLKEVEDMAPSGGLAPNLEARFARKPLELEQSGLSYFRMAPGFREPFGHSHGTQEEVYVVVRGSGLLKLDDEIIEVERLDAIRVSPDVTRAFEAGDEGLEVIAFGPRRDGDGEIDPDFWTD